MAESEVLLTTAEVAVAFAGFATLASLLGRRYSRDDPRLDALRLMNMLDSGLLVVAFSLFPHLPAYFGASEPAVWRLSSLAFLGAGVALAWRIQRRSRRTARTGLRTWNLFAAFNWLASSVAILALALNGLAVFPGALFALYLTALFLALFVSGAQFSRVIGSVLSLPDPE